MGKESGLPLTIRLVNGRPDPIRIPKLRFDPEHSSNPWFMRNFFQHPDNASSAERLFHYQTRPFCFILIKWSYRFLLQADKKSCRTLFSKA